MNHVKSCSGFRWRCWLRSARPSPSGPARENSAARSPAATARTSPRTRRSLLKDKHDKWDHDVRASPATTATTATRPPRSAGKSAASRTTTSRESATGSARPATRTTGSAPTTTRRSLATGLGYKFIDTERTKFWVQGGPGYRYRQGARYRRTSRRHHLPRRPRLRAPADREHQDHRPVPDRDGCRQHLPAERPRPRGHDHRARSGCGLGYQVRYNTDVPPGIEKTDTLTTLGLLYETK